MMAIPIVGMPRYEASTKPMKKNASVFGDCVRLKSMAKPSAASRFVPVPMAFMMFSGMALAILATTSAPMSRLRNTDRNMNRHDAPKMTQKA